MGDAGDAEKTSMPTPNPSVTPLEDKSKAKEKDVSKEKSKDSKSLTVAYLEKSLLLMIDAMNARELYAPIFNLCSSDFQGMKETPSGTTILNLKDHLAALKMISDEFPNAKDRAVDISVNVIDGGYAEVFLHGETLGAPEGVVRQNLGVLEWRKVRRKKGEDAVGEEGYEWECFKYRGIRGMAGPELMGGNRSDLERLASD